MGWRALFAFLFVAALTGCSGPQSALSVGGTDAERTAHLFYVMSIGTVIVWIAVVAAAIYATRVPGGTYTGREGALFILGGGVVLPTVVLAALLWYGLPMLPKVMALAPDNALRIRVVGQQWWWRVEYVSPDRTVETANELHLPVGQRVELELSSVDVIHSFWVPSLAGKMDMIPGRITRLALEPTRTGVFRGACAEYCGASHAHMALDVTVVGASEFERWLDAQAAPAPMPVDDAPLRGWRAFDANGCGACHTIRGTTAAGRIGPELTHLSSRRHLAAGTLPRSPGAIAAWIQQTEHFKPGVHMPAFRALSSDDLTGLAAFLDGLR
jgi:cytochrome c oxidase subunit II